MRDTPEGIVEELRDAARERAAELGVEAADLTEWEAADLVDHLRGQLQRIAEGETPAHEIAAEALDAKLWILGDPSEEP